MGKHIVACPARQRRNSHVSCQGVDVSAEVLCR